MFVGYFRAPVSSVSLQQPSISFELIRSMLLGFILEDIHKQPKTMMVTHSKVHKVLFRRILENSVK